MRKFGKILLITVLVICLGYFIVQFFVKKKVDSALGDLVDKGEITYADYKLNLIKADFSIDSLTYFSKANTVFVEELKIHRIGLFEYLFNKNFKAAKISLNNPEIKLVKNSEKESPEEDSKSNQFDTNIWVDEINIEDAGLVYKEDTLTKLRLKDYNINLREIKVDQESVKNKIPFEYDSYAISGGKLWYLLSDLQTLTTESVEILSKEAVFRDLRLIPNYSRKDYIKVIPFEKDLMDLKMGNLSLYDYNFAVDATRNQLDIKKVAMDSIDFQIYRNKLVNDDPNEKKMYSAMLRDLPFDLNIDSLKVRKAALSYEEVQEKTGKTGKVFFTNMSVDVSSLTNWNMQQGDFPETLVDIDCQFMGDAPLQALWTFKVNRPEDNFRIKGKGVNIPPKALNSFFEPAFNMKATGENIKALYFDFHGDKKIAQGEFHMVYDHLKVEVLKKGKGQGKDKVLSFFANLLMNHKNKSGDQVVEVSDVERDPTRSFWNYFWNCIFTGLKETLI